MIQIQEPITQTVKLVNVLEQLGVDVTVVPSVEAYYPNDVQHKAVFSRPIGIWAADRSIGEDSVYLGHKWFDFDYEGPLNGGPDSVLSCLAHALSFRHVSTFELVKKPVFFSLFSSTERKIVKQLDLTNTRVVR